MNISLKILIADKKTLLLLICGLQEGRLYKVSQGLNGVLAQIVCLPKNLEFYLSKVAFSQNIEMVKLKYMEWFTKYWKYSLNIGIIHKVLECSIRYLKLKFLRFESLEIREVSISLGMSSKTSKLTVMHLKPFKSRCCIIPIFNLVLSDFKIAGAAGVFLPNDLFGKSIKKYVGVQSWKAAHLPTLEIRVEQKGNRVKRDLKGFKCMTVSLDNFGDFSRR